MDEHDLAPRPARRALRPSALVALLVVVSVSAFAAGRWSAPSSDKMVLTGGRSTEELPVTTSSAPAEITTTTAAPTTTTAAPVPSSSSSSSSSSSTTTTERQHGQSEVVVGTGLGLSDDGCDGWPDGEWARIIGCPGQSNESLDFSLDSSNFPAWADYRFGLGLEVQRGIVKSCGWDEGAAPS